MHGEGKLTFKDGVIYEGEFKFQQITGKVDSQLLKINLRVNTYGQMVLPIKAML